MIDSTTLRTIAVARLEDARILLNSNRFDGAAYICGYAVELSLKARICDTLGWLGYPETSGEFKDLSNFKVHNLHVLLHLSGKENDVQTRFVGDWSIVKSWKPEQRYGPVGHFSEPDAREFLRATTALIQQL